MRCDGLHGDGELVPQQFKAPAGFLRIGAAIALGLFLVRIGGFFGQLVGVGGLGVGLVVGSSGSSPSGSRKPETRSLMRLSLSMMLS